MDEILASTLSRAVFGRLDYLDDLVYAADQRSLSALADTEIVRLTETVREMLDQHRPDARGHCPQCSGWFRHRRHPCSVWTTAHQHLLGPNGTASNGQGRHIPAAGRPSVATLGFPPPTNTGRT
jgi:hypothetical protein